MKLWICILAAPAILLGCVSNEAQIRGALKKNPQLLFDVTEEHPEAFLESVNKAAQLAQQKQYENRAQQARLQQEKDLKDPKNPQVESTRILYGSPEAPITIVEYADFECPACRMAQQSLEDIKAKYPGKIRFVYKNMPLSFHKMAVPAAIYFEAIRLQDKNKARQFHKLLFQNQSQLSETYLRTAAKQVGADLKKLEKDIQSPVVNNIIKEDMEEFESFGFNGTPVLIVNGVSLYGAQPAEEISRIIELTANKKAE